MDRFEQLLRCASALADGAIVETELGKMDFSARNPRLQETALARAEDALTWWPGDHDDWHDAPPVGVHGRTYLVRMPLVLHRGLLCMNYATALNLPLGHLGYTGVRMVLPGQPWVDAPMHAPLINDLITFMKDYPDLLKGVATVYARRLVLLAPYESVLPRPDQTLDAAILATQRSVTTTPLTIAAAEQTLRSLHTLTTMLQTTGERRSIIYADVIARHARPNQKITVHGVQYQVQRVDGTPVLVQGRFPKRRSLGSSLAFHPATEADRLLFTGHLKEIQAGLIGQTAPALSGQTL